MNWQPQPGTVPFRAIAWMRENGDGKPVSTAVICDALGIDSNGFSTSMRPAVKAGYVKGQQLRGFGHAYFWTLEREPEIAEVDAPDDDGPLSGKASEIVPRPGLLFPGVSTENSALPSEREFRATEFEGKLLVTGIRIIDNVAIFEPDQVLQLKRHTDWWRASA